MVVSTALVAIAALNQNVVLAIPYVRPFLIWVGERSFSIYLSHPLVIYIDNWLRSYVSFYVNLPVAVQLSINIAAMLMVGYLSYLFVELPGEKVGVKLLKRIKGSAFWPALPFEIGNATDLEQVSESRLT
jgi:peptidoglycan/LPS O-acetylase OafA/YrhL